MNNPAVAETAHLIAKLVSHRRTSGEEIPDLIHTVHYALSRLGTAEESEKPEPVEDAAPARHSAPRKPRAARREPVAAIVVEAVAEPVPAPPPQPRLLRRAEVISVAPLDEATPTSLLSPRSGVVRGVVQWFDARTGHGTLRLPGLSNDMPVTAEMLSSWGITRLYRGQEVTATLGGAGDAARLLGLTLPGSTAPMLSSAGTVRDRHAKTVVVELKREALRRGAARAEAELLLKPRRAR
jgi:cold shock CspA family protein